ncbi:uncharacterized protein LOC143869231 [Tasmannia lanceolata]|uniref:uncharacterized protein LOC143869231 n=1 Tax=Tasmannia lanceolata TaxID=3420 RepID=UPI0040647B5A
MLEGAKSIGAGAATIASAGAAVGIGNVPSSSIHSVARNPSLAKQSFGYAILGFALTEAIASFAPMMAFLISSVFRSKKRSFILRKRRPWSNRACKTPSERESVSHALAMGRGEVRRAPSLSVRQRLYFDCPGAGLVFMELAECAVCPRICRKCCASSYRERF